MLYILVDTSTISVNTRRGILFVEDVHLSCISLGTQRYETYATPVAWAGYQESAE